MDNKYKILIIDDDRAILDSCSQVLIREKYIVKTAENGEEGLKLIKEESFDVILLDLKMPGLSGEEVLKMIVEEAPETLVIIITAYASIESAVNAIKTGAFNYLSKPFTPDQLRVLVRKAIEYKNMMLENIYLKSTLTPGKGIDKIIGESDVIKSIKEMILKVGPTDSTVLITGESGTGKELVARAIHTHSNRANGPFIVVDCSALVETLFESELFGHVKGSFTGATATKFGRFELANGGTIFFDEVSNINLNIQAKLLRAIQEKEITRVGSNKSIKIDARIIAATNRELEQFVKEGRFREDLYYRLNVIQIKIPPLRERKEDIPLLAKHFLERFNKKIGKNLTISESALNRLTEYPWPGNVRELENLMERTVILTKGNEITPENLLFYNTEAHLNTHTTEIRSYKTLREMEKEYITKVLKDCNGNKTLAAEILGIDRKTLREKLKDN